MIAERKSRRHDDGDDVSFREKSIFALKCCSYTPQQDQEESSANLSKLLVVKFGTV